MPSAIGGAGTSEVVGTQPAQCRRRDTIWIALPSARVYLIKSARADAHTHTQTTIEYERINTL